MNGMTPRVIAVAMLAGIFAAAAGIETSMSAQAAGPAQTVPALDADLTPLTAKNLVGHRLWMIVFDKSAMQLADVQRSAADAVTWSRNKTANVDVVAVAVISSTGTEVLQDFTTNDAKIQRALAAFNAEPIDAAATRLGAPASDLDALSNDTRLTGLKTICDALKPWTETKEMLYFTAGLARAGGDNQLQDRDTVAACEKAHVTIDSVDARGLTALGRPTGAAARGDISPPSVRAESDARGRSTERAPRSVPASAAPQFSGTWQCDRCPTTLEQSATALWLGPAFTVSYAPHDTPTVIAFTPPAAHVEGWTFAPLAWSFNLTGSTTTNPDRRSKDVRWISAVSWDRDQLVLTMTGTVSHDGQSVPVVVTHVLTLITTDGPEKGDLQVVTTSSPSGLVPDGVATYKKIG